MKRLGSASSAQPRRRPVSQAVQKQNVFESEVPGGRFAGEGCNLQCSFVRKLDVEDAAVATSCASGVIAHHVVDCTCIRQPSGDDGGRISSLELDYALLEDFESIEGTKKTHPNITRRKKVVVRGLEEFGAFADVFASLFFDSSEGNDLGVEVGHEVVRRPVDRSGESGAVRLPQPLRKGGEDFPFSLTKEVAR